MDDIIEKMPEQFNIVEMMAKCEDRTPYIVVCFQVPACLLTLLWIQFAMYIFRRVSG